MALPRISFLVLVAARSGVGFQLVLADAAHGPSLNDVLDSLRLWAVGLLAGLATLFLTIGGIRYMIAGGDPGQVERAKTAMKCAAIGYSLAALAPVLVAVLRSVVKA